MSLDVALQEWSSVCAALGDGRLTLLVRKGGIHERGGGLFIPEHERFALWPTHLHESPERLRPGSAELQLGSLALSTESTDGVISIIAQSVKVFKVTDLAKLLTLGDELLWTDAELATRFAYRNQPHLYVLVLRILRLPAPVIIPDDPSYAGCRSWLRLKTNVPVTGAVPVLNDATFVRRLSRISSVLE
jgi:hypothetical protein